jgi:hypothetical protein
MASDDDTPEKVLWALCDLLPLRKTIFLLSTAKIDPFTSAVNYWKKGQPFEHKGVHGQFESIATIDIIQFQPMSLL